MFKTIDRENAEQITGVQFVSNDDLVKVSKDYNYIYIETPETELYINALDLDLLIKALQELQKL